ncbi:hypothetical protein LAB1_55900 [Roseibium sp. LAB1]
MPHPARIPRIVDRSGKPVGQLQAPLGHRQQHHTAVGSDAATVERSSDLLPTNGWKSKRHQSIVGHGECGSKEAVNGLD